MQANRPFLCLFNIRTQATPLIKSPTGGEPNGEHQRHHGGYEGDDGDDQLILNSYAGRLTAEYLTNHRAGQSHYAHHGHVCDTWRNALHHALAKERQEGIEPQEAVAEIIVVGRLPVLQVAVEGGESHDVHTEHIPEEDAHDGDEVLGGEDVVQTHHDGQRVASDQNGSNEHTDKDGYGSYATRQTSAAHGGVCGDKSHDNHPEHIHPRVVPLEEVAQIDADERQLHNHAQRSHKHRLDETCAQPPQEEQRDKQDGDGED